ARRQREARAEQPVEPATLHREPNARKHRDQHRSERDHRVEHEPDLGEIKARAQARIREEQCEQRTEQAEEQHFAPEPRLVRVFLFSHLPLFGRTDPTDKGGEGLWRPVSSSSTTIRSPAVRSRRCLGRTTSASSARLRAARRRSRSRENSSPTWFSSTCRCPGSAASGPCGSYVRRRRAVRS